MSDKELIWRGDVEKFLCDAYDYDMIDEGELAYLLSEANKLPTVPREMTAREYEKAIDRVFYSDDDAYGEWADAIDEGNKDKAVAIIEKWAKEHPEEVNHESMPSH